MMRAARQRLRDWVLQGGSLRSGWGAYRRWQLHRGYLERRERYARAAADRALVYRRPEIEQAVRARLAARGWTPVLRAPGTMHTFALVPGMAWHRSLLDDLQELGPVSHFDYVANGFRYEDFYPPNRRTAACRAAMNERAFEALRSAHARQPVDWVFVYASGGEITTALMRRITDELGVPTVSMYLDDKHCWDGELAGDQRTGQIAIASVFDLSWTSARVACEWYMAEGGRPVYLPEGFDAATYKPSGAVQDLPVSFIGGAYGFRPQVIEHLRRSGIEVSVFGPGWPGSGWVPDIAAVMSRSQVNLGMGGIGYSPRLVNLKGRDFEIPAVGGGVYLTTYNPDLAEHFVIGSEILCYGNEDEMVELVRYCLARPEEAREIARRGRQRCLREHRWRHRFEAICGVLGILPAGTAAGRAAVEGARL